MLKNRILVIDDDQLFLGALEAFLTNEQFYVKTLDKSWLIEETIFNFRPDLILLDIDLGQADGRLICNNLKASTATANTPIILLTGLSHSDISKIDCSADAIMGKACESSMLLFNIRQLL